MQSAEVIILNSQQLEHKAQNFDALQAEYVGLNFQLNEFETETTGAV